MSLDHSTQANPSVLVVEDDDQHRLFLSELLKSEGYQVDLAKDGYEADKALKAQHYDLLLTDIVMPEKEGIELIFEVQKSYPNLPIIGMSGGGAYSNLDYLDAALTAGAKRVFAKPIDIDELIATIASILQNSSQPLTDV